VGEDAGGRGDVLGVRASRTGKIAEHWDILQEVRAQYIQHPVPETTASGTATSRQLALDNLHEPMTVTDLAEHSHMSLRTFAHRFTEEVGMSPGR
jgi:transcriptional regulator GlxA family with amidase domain